MSTVLTEIKKEHDEARELLAKISKSKKVTWSDVETLYVMLKGHHEAEEHVLFPKVKPVDKQATKLVSHLTEEHDEYEESLLALIKNKPFDREIFSEIDRGVRAHMEEEETKLFQKTKKAMKADELESIVDPFEKAEEAGKRKAKKELPKD